MPFRVPNMPLLCNIYTGPYPPNWIPNPVPRIAAVACQLRFLKTANAFGVGVGAGASKQLLLVLAGTDIRMVGFGTNQDFVEVPAGSARVYNVVSVDDVAKGFANTYRVAVLTSLNSQIANSWVPPYP